MAFLLTFLVRRLLQGAVIVLLISFTIFALLRIVPGDPVRLMLGPMTPDNVIEEQAQKLGLRDPIPVQYAQSYAAPPPGPLEKRNRSPGRGA